MSSANHHRALRSTTTIRLDSQLYPKGTEKRRQIRDHLERAGFLDFMTNMLKGYLEHNGLVDSADNALPPPDYEKAVKFDEFLALPSQNHLKLFDYMQSFALQCKANALLPLNSDTPPESPTSSQSSTQS